MTDERQEDREIAYLALGRLIAGQCPAGFERASLRMEIVGDRSELSIDTVQPDGTETRFQPSPAAAEDILELLRNIRREMAEEDGAAWKGCTVTLRAGGHFAMDVDH